MLQLASTNVITEFHLFAVNKHPKGGRVTVLNNAAIAIFRNTGEENSLEFDPINYGYSSHW